MSKADKKCSYVAHCETCGKMLALCTEDADGVEEMVSKWVGMDNVFIERHPVDQARKLPFCDYAMSEETHA